MDSEKIGKFIKELRKKNNLTQKDLAKKYGVTYQAVSKWERGINIPDISLIRKMSKDFKIDIEDILDGEIKEKKKDKEVKKEKEEKKEINEDEEDNGKLIYPIIFGIVGFIFLGLLIALLFLKTGDPTPKETFKFKTLSTTCEEFKVTGVIAYDETKSSINISSINYCGGDDEVVYDKITCELFEEEGKKKTSIAKCNDDGEKVKLEDYLGKAEVKVDNYEQECKNYSDNKLYLEIKATKDKKTTVYQVDLKMEANCPVVKEKKNESKGTKSK